MDLAHIHTELVDELREGMHYVAEAKSIATLADLFDAFALQFEALGLCHLLELADADELRECLVRSASSRRYFLRRSALEGNTDDRHLALGRTRSFLDAVAAGSLPVARDIARLSGDTWHEDWEYEDDFCFMLLLHRLVLEPDPLPMGVLQAILARFERALQGASSARYDIGKALVNRHPRAFAAALEALLADEQASLDAERDSSAVHEGDMLYWPRSQVSIEGLALLNMAELIGLQVPDALPLCPPMARLAWTNQSFVDLFEEIERIG